MTSRLASRQLTLNEINTSTESAVLNSGTQPLARARVSGPPSRYERLDGLEDWDPKVSDAHYNEPNKFFEPLTAWRLHRARIQVFALDRSRRLTDLQKNKVRGEAECPLCGEDNRGPELRNHEADLLQIAFFRLNDQQERKQIFG